MAETSIVYLMFLIFSGAAVIATATLYARQALIVAYIFLGYLLGPWGIGVIEDTHVIAEISEVGIIFLLFLLGLSLEPADLTKLFREALKVTLLSSMTFAAFGYALCQFSGFSVLDSAIVGAAMMFSSTIIGLKLLPTSALHHQRMGEIMVSILLLQDMIAIVLLLVLQGAGNSEQQSLMRSILPILMLPLLAAGAYYFTIKVLFHLLAKFDQIKEYIFLLSIGWCLGIAQLAHDFGLSHEIGAFIAGVTLAAQPLCRHIAESLKPLRDFFLIIFFFTLGAGFDMSVLGDVWLLASALAIVALFGKPLLFKKLLEQEKEKKRLAGELGVRMGQISEFSLLLAVVATQSNMLTHEASMTIQAATIITFIASSYWIVMKHPTPIAVDDALRRD